MEMKNTGANLLSPGTIFCLILWAMAPLAAAQGDREERLQEKVEAFDQRTDFSERKTAPVKIDSPAYRALAKAKIQYLRARKRLEESRQQLTVARADRSGLKTLDAAKRQIRVAGADVETAKTALLEAASRARSDRD